MKETVEIVEAVLKNKINCIGVSDIHDLTSIKDAYKESLFALSARNLINKKIIIYNKLGILRFFWEDEKRLNIPFVTNYYIDNFKPLVDYDEKNNSELVDTLDILLKCDLSIPRTAEHFFIHENTLRARLKRIEKITNRNLKKPYDLFALMLGLQIHHFIKRKS